MLAKAILKYQNRAIETAQVIEELIGLAKDMKAAHARGEKLGLSEDELAFYDALETNDSPVKVLGEPTLTLIARELLKAVRGSAAIDWTVRENVRADAGARETHTAQIRIPARFAGKGHAHGVAAGGATSPVVGLTMFP